MNPRITQTGIAGKRVAGAEARSGPGDQGWKAMIGQVAAKEKNGLGDEDICESGVGSGKCMCFFPIRRDCGMEIAHSCLAYKPATMVAL